MHGALFKTPQVLRALGVALHREDRAELLAREAEAILAAVPPQQGAHCALFTVEDQTASTWRRLARARRRYLRCLVGSRWLLRAPARHTTRVSMRSGHLIQTCSFSRMPECVRLLQTRRNGERYGPCNCTAPI